MWIIASVRYIENGEWFENLFESLLMLSWTVQCYQNGYILFIYVNMSFAFFKTWLWKVSWGLRKNENLKRLYHVEGRIARRDGYYILRDVSCAMIVTIIESRVVGHNKCMDWYVPHRSQTEKQRVCISASLYLTLHSISLHILIISELDIVLRWSCDCLSVELVIVEHWACYWGYLICWSVIIEDI